MSAVHKLITDHLDIWTAADTEKKSGRGRASGNANSVYGIKKLRELILELAVRGKLVPQDPNDEPASELLKRIQAEKANMVAEGRLKKEKLPAAGDEAIAPHRLPDSWNWTTLRLIAIVNPRNVADDNLDASFVPMTMIDSKFNTAHEQEIRVWKEIKQGFTHFAEGDIGVAKITPCFENSKACVFANLKNGIGAGTTELHIVRPISDLLFSRYVLAYFKSPQFLAVGETQMTGTAGQKRLPKEFVESNPFPLPPLAEQHRIVAKVDELMALCDQLEAQHNNAADAHEQLVSHLLSTLTQSQDAADFNANWQRIATHFDTLFTTESSIDALKQSLLQLAVMGKLVPQDPNDEPASELLKRIQAEKAKLIAEGKIRKDKTPMPIGNEEKQFNTPLGWSWVRFSLVANTRLGKMLDQAKNKGVYRPYLRNTNVQWGTFELDDLKEMRFEEHELDEYRLNAGDLVICEGGEPGRSAVWENQMQDMFIQKALHRARPWPGISAYFLKMHLKVDADRGHLARFFTGATIKHFSGEKLGSYPIALPPENEQRRIVIKVNELMDFCDDIKNRIIRKNLLVQQLANALTEQKH